MDATSIIELLLTALVTDGRLLRVGELWQRDENNYDKIPAMIDEGLINQWQEDYIYVTPKGLAVAPEHLRELIVSWVDDAAQTLAEADRAKPDSNWTAHELAARCGVPELQMRVALLYRGCLLHDIRGLSQIDNATGLPGSVGLNFAIRRTPKSLSSIVAGLKSVLDSGGSAESDSSENSMKYKLEAQSWWKTIPSFESIDSRSFRARAQAPRVLLVVATPAELKSFPTNPPAAVFGMTVAL